MLVACGPRAIGQMVTNTNTSVALLQPVATAGPATAAGSSSNAGDVEQASSAAGRTPVKAGTVAAPASLGAGAVGSTSPALTTARATSASSRAAATTAAVASTVTVYAYFTQGNQLVKEQREVSSTAPLRESINSLLAGPKDSGHFTQVPKGTRLLDVNLAGPNVLIDLSSQAENIQGSPAIPLFLAQVVSTATQFPAVRQVTLRIAGQPVTSLGGEGMAIPEPLDQSAVQKMLQTP